jgi:hypothetical protein
MKFSGIPHATIALDFIKRLNQPFPMPNRLAASKRRQTLAEHAAVLAALREIAHHEKTSVMALLRTAAREVIRQRIAYPAQTAAIQRAIAAKAPAMPVQFKTAAQVARFKRSQREYDQVMQDVNFASAQDVQRSNSIASSYSVKLVDFDRAHAASR